MAALTQTSIQSNQVVTATVNTLSASDTLTYTNGTNQILELHNTTGGSLTAVIKGTAPSATFAVSNGQFTTTIDLSAGLSVVVPAAGKKIIKLDNFAPYLAGSTAANNVTVTGAATLQATLMA